jgi:hypothetical protein
MKPRLPPRGRRVEDKSQSVGQYAGCVPARADEAFLKTDNVRLERSKPVAHQPKSSRVVTFILPGIERDDPHRRPQAAR